MSKNGGTTVSDSNVYENVEELLRSRPTDVGKIVNRARC